MPASWCPTFLTLYGIAALLTQLHTPTYFSMKLKAVFLRLMQFSGLLLLPIGIYATITFTLGMSFAFDIFYLYAQSIHVSETLTGVITAFCMRRKLQVE